MNRTTVFIGVVLAGAVGPALGISGNSQRAWGMIIAAVCISIVGIGLMLQGVYSRRA